MDSGCLEPTLEKILNGHKSIISSLSYNPNEKQVACGCVDKSVLLWDLNGKKNYRFRGHDEAVTDVVFSPDGKYMASASRDKTVRLWVPTVTGSTGMFKAHSQTVRSVQFSPDGTKMITASDDKIIKLWFSNKYKFIASLIGHTNWVRRACFSQDGSLVASCSDDKTVRLWNPETRKSIHTYKDQKGYGMYLSWHPSSCYIAVGTSQGNVQLYDIRTHTLVQYYRIHNESINQLDFHPSGSYIITASKDGNMKILDLLEGHPLFTLRAQCNEVNAVRFSPGGNYFASGDDKQLCIWRTNFTEPSEVKENVNVNIHSTSMSQTSKGTVLSKAKSKGAKIWYKCYHSSKYPATTYIHVDNINETLESSREPIAHSTFVESSPLSDNSMSDGSRGNTTNHTYSVGHMSHIPRTPPTPTTFTIPPIIKKTIINEDTLFGMIRLGDNDVCYTSGTIEWVGRKRTFPLNTGFKILDKYQEGNEASIKKVKTAHHTITLGDENRDCDCADVLPTVNAIVDHLNALHEAVDLVDLRLSSVEGVVSKN